MIRTKSLGAVLALAALVACGGSGKKDRLGEAPGPGGSFRIASLGDVDSLDPARGNNPFSRMLFRVMVRNLVHYPALPGAEGNTLVGDIATDTGQVTGGGVVYTFQIRPGVKYQPEVAGGREVSSADFRYAIERAFYPSVASPLARAYFGDLFVGDEEFVAAPGPDKHIGGIDVTDPKRIVFRLKRPAGDFLFRLALPLAAPVPDEYARTFDLTPRSAYAANLAATGPYQIQRSGSTVTGYEPGDRIVLVRNPSWSAASDPIRKAYPDRIEVAERFDQADVATDAILNGDLDYNGDFSIPADRVEEILNTRSQKDRVFINPGTCLRYVALNTTIPPLDNVKVRQAIAYALDKASMRARRGGRRAGVIAGHVITPGQLGFAEAGGLRYDPYPSDDAGGNATKAQETLKESG
ncbi:MAG: ABC transporter substrate-binding protein, partial [Actinomycetota bacterium]